MRIIFCLFLSSEHCTVLISWHLLKHTVSSQEQDLSMFLPSPTPLTNDCSTHLQGLRSTSQGSMPGWGHQKNCSHENEAVCVWERVGGSTENSNWNLVPLFALQLKWTWWGLCTQHYKGKTLSFLWFQYLQCWNMVGIQYTFVPFLKIKIKYYLQQHGWT